MRILIQAPAALSVLLCQLARDPSEFLLIILEDQDKFSEAYFRPAAGWS
jgi:hypothetical protein